MAASSRKPNRESRERKMRRIRRHLQRFSRGRNFQKHYAGLIRELRYLRMRNQEVALLNNVMRLQVCYRTRRVLLAFQHVSVDDDGPGKRSGDANRGNKER
mmetsp:Transcript_22489/g.63724  ORF Transcript_22489/g.63724 Transcript_22489/m.63724 type:complete len:101 (-) Transcript_22489:608-910(-)